MIKKISGSVLAAVAIFSVATNVMAKEDKFPAADFKPEVVYQNAEMIKQTAATQTSTTATAATTAPDPKYPAAVFNPVVLQKAILVEAPHAADPKYPAAYFNPTLVYPK